jgi:RNA polymerase sigma factor (TIGR02999 family)
MSEESHRPANGANDPEQFFVAAIDELRRIAAQLLADERPDHTLQPTALVNELYLRMAGTRLDGWESRAGFFAFAAKAMRWILVDHARRRARLKRQLPASDEPLFAGGRLPPSPDELIDLDRALEELSHLNERAAKVVELRHFLGLSFVEVARALDIGLATVHRDWAAARAWLYRSLAAGPAAEESAQSALGQ